MSNKLEWGLCSVDEDAKIQWPAGEKAVKSTSNSTSSSNHTPKSTTHKTEKKTSSKSNKEKSGKSSSNSANNSAAGNTNFKQHKSTQINANSTSKSGSRDDAPQKQRREQSNVNRTSSKINGMNTDKNREHFSTNTPTNNTSTQKVALQTHHHEKKSATSSNGGSSKSRKVMTKRLSLSDIGEYVKEYLINLNLNWAIDFFDKVGFSLEIVPYLDSPQLDEVFAQTNDKSNNNNIIQIDPVEKIKLVCALKSLRVQILAASQQPTNTNGSITNTPNITNTNQLATSPPRTRPSWTQQDPLTWTIDMVVEWVRAIPTLQHIAPSIIANQIDGSALLKLNDKKLLHTLKLASPIDRRLLLQNINDLKAIQVSNPSCAYQDIIDRIVNQLGVELETLKVQKKSPNFFLSLRIGDATIQSHVRSIQSDITSRIPVLQGSKCILPPEQLHFTIGRLHLQTEQDQLKAKEVLDGCASICEQIYHGKPVTITFKGVANYGGNAVFVETEKGEERDNLTELGNTVFEIFKDAGLTSRHFRFQPVAPIIRVHTSKKEALPMLKELSTTLLPSYEDKVFGKYTFAALEISCVATETDEDGYYKCLHALQINGN